MRQRKRGWGQAAAGAPEARTGECGARDRDEDLVKRVEERVLRGVGRHEAVTASVAAAARLRRAAFGESLAEEHAVGRERGRLGAVVVALSSRRASVLHEAPAAAGHVHHPAGRARVVQLVVRGRAVRVHRARGNRARDGDGGHAGRGVGGRQRRAVTRARLGTASGGAVSPERLRPAEALLRRGGGAGGGVGGSGSGDHGGGEGGGEGMPAHLRVSPARLRPRILPTGW